MDNLNLKEMVRVVSKEHKNMCSIIKGKEDVKPSELIGILRNIKIADEQVCQCDDKDSQNNITESGILANESVFVINDDKKKTIPVIKKELMPITNPIINNPKNSSYNVAFDFLLNKTNDEPLFSQLNLESQLEFSECLISVLPIKNRDGKLYIYNDRFYELVDDNTVRKAVVKYFRKQLRKKNANFLDGIIRFLKCEPTTSFDDKQIRRDLLCFENLILNLNTGETYPHDKCYITTYAINAKYLGNTVPTPVFDKFLYRITGGDNLLAERIMQIIGYILTCDMGAKSLFIFQGVSNSGKSVLCKLIQSMFSINAYMPIQADKLNGRFSLSEIYGKSLLICSDFTSAPISEECTSILKQITGSDTLASDQKYREAVRFESYAKIIICSNHPVVTKTQDTAFENRIVAVPFQFSIPKTEQNSSIVEEMLNERDGIATKAIFAYWRVRNNKYVFSGDYEPNLVVENYDKQNSIEIDIYNFVNSAFELDVDSIVYTTDAYDEYIKVNKNISQNQFSQYFKKFAHSLYNAIDTRKRKEGANNPTHCVIGIKFKEL